MGRPSKLEKDPGLAQRIAEKVEQWNAPSVAAQSEGVSTSTFYEWMERGEQGIEPYLAFSESIARAVAVAEVSAVEVLKSPPLDERRKADGAIVRAAQFYLERTRRERFGQSIEIKQKAEETLRGALTRLRERLDPGVWRQVLAALAGDGGVEDAGRGDRRH